MSASIASTTSASTSQILPSQTLDQADFLKLLVTQMSSQDPLNPESDTDFAAQLAQFSALQTAQDTETDLSNIQADSLIGQTVTLTPSAGSTPITGVVSSVQFSSNTPSLVVNGQTYSLSQLSAVTPTTVTPTTSTSTQTQ
ncbi:MAG: flagellar hook capping FlgD N-terminal domain-containing protein [Verrucomicrobiota bacterium]|jgi:flagellar basal-body rod modification protein FlgD